MSDSGYKTDETKDELIAVGQIRRPFRLRGQSYIDVFGKTVASFTPPVPVLLGLDENNVKEELLQSLQYTAKGYLCSFKGYDTVEDAQLLRGRYIFVDRKRVPALKNNEYFAFELEGMKVISVPDNKFIGLVKEVQSYPTVDAIKVVRDSASPILISINKAIIEKVDKENKCISVYKDVIEQLI